MPASICLHQRYRQRPIVVADLQSQTVRSGTNELVLLVIGGDKPLPLRRIGMPVARTEQPFAARTKHRPQFAQLVGSQCFDQRRHRRFGAVIASTGYGGPAHGRSGSGQRSARQNNEENDRSSQPRFDHLDAPSAPAALEAAAAEPATMGSAGAGPSLKSSTATNPALAQARALSPPSAE